MAFLLLYTKCVVAPMTVVFELCRGGWFRGMLLWTSVRHERLTFGFSGGTIGSSELPNPGKRARTSRQVFALGCYSGGLVPTTAEHWRFLGNPT